MLSWGAGGVSSHPEGIWVFQGRGGSTRSAETPFPAATVTPAHLPRHLHHLAPPSQGRNRRGKSLPSFKLGSSPPAVTPGPGRRGEGQHRCSPGSRCRRPLLQTWECSHPSEWSFSLKSRLRSAAGRLLSGCQRRPEQRHMQQSFTRRASVWGEGRERDRPPHAHTRTRTRRNLLQAPSSSHPNVDFFLSSFFFFFFLEEQRLWGGLALLFFRGWCWWTGGGWMWRGGAGGLNARKSRISLAELLRSSVRNLEEERRGRKGGGK